MQSRTPTERETTHFSVSFVPGSFAEQTLGQVHARLESAYDVVVRMLDLESIARPRIRVRLVDAVEPAATGLEWTASNLGSAAPGLQAAASGLGAARRGLQAAGSGPELAGRGSELAEGGSGAAELQLEYYADHPAPDLEKGVLRVLVQRQRAGKDAGTEALPAFIEDGLVANVLRRMGPIGSMAAPEATPGAPGALPPAPARPGERADAPSPASLQRGERPGVPAQASLQPDAPSPASLRMDERTGEQPGVLPSASVRPGVPSPLAGPNGAQATAAAGAGAPVRDMPPAIGVRPPGPAAAGVRPPAAGAAGGPPRTAGPGVPSGLMAGPAVASGPMGAPGVPSGRMGGPGVASGPMGGPGPAGPRGTTPEDPEEALLLDARRRKALPSISALIQGRAAVPASIQGQPAGPGLIREQPAGPGALLQGQGAVPGGLRHAAAGSFVRFLLESYTPRQLQTFVSTVSSDQADAAARTAFGHSLADLDARWRSGLGATPTGGVGRMLRSLMPFFRGHELQAAEIVVELLATVGYTTLVVAVQRPLIDAIGQGDLTSVRNIIVELLLLFVASALLSLRQTYATATLTQQVVSSIRLRLFALLQRMDAQFFAERQSADILSRASMDVNFVEQLLSLTLPQILSGLIQLVLAIAVLMGSYPRFGVFLVIAIPLIVIVGRYFGPRAALASRARQQNMAVLMSTLQEDLAAQPVVKAFGLERLLTVRYERDLHQFARSAVRMSFVSGLTSLSNQTVTTAVQLAILGIGAWAAVWAAVGVGQPAFAAFLNNPQPLTGGAVVATLGLTMQVVGAVRQLSGMTQMLQQASGPMERVDELMRTEPAIADAPNATHAAPLAHELRLENVWFGYTRTQAVLRGIDLTIPAGSNVAIVGPSGCGKSTLLGLLQRSFDPNAGSVRLDGDDLRHLTLESVRGQQGIVFQESVLFDLSIRENIRMGKLDATDAEVEEAARKAEIHEVILALPEGYDTRVGERGGRLSGGQRQRVAIARAILREPTILLLDEATSALDPASEAAINRTLQELAVDRTTISVTHRLNTITHADQIYVLDRGTVAEHGTHDELLARGGLYARLWHEQMDAALQDAAGSRVADVERLRAVPLFAGVDTGQLARLASRLRAERFNRGDDVVRQGDAGDKLYLIEQGQADVLMADPSGAERHLALLNPNDYFGEVALLRDVPRTATVRARSALLVSSLSKEDFVRAVSAVPELRSALERTIASRRPKPAAAPAAPTLERR